MKRRGLLWAALLTPIVLVLLVVMTSIAIRSSLAMKENGCRKQWERVRNAYLIRLDLSAQATLFGGPPAPDATRLREALGGEDPREVGRIAAEFDAREDSDFRGRTNLESNEAYLDLQRRLTRARDRISEERKNYDRLVTEYNAAARALSGVPGCGRFGQRPTFE